MTATDELSILDANGAIACAECGRQARAVRDRLKAENDKLRELVEDMLDCIEIRAAFNRPPTTEMHEQFAKRASELGVEVDEDVDCRV